MFRVAAAMERFICDECKASFKYKYNLNKHKKKNHDNSKQHQCKKCLKVFNKKECYSRHKCEYEDIPDHIITCYMSLMDKQDQYPGSVVVPKKFSWDYTDKENKKQRELNQKIFLEPPIIPKRNEEGPTLKETSEYSIRKVRELKPNVHGFNETEFRIKFKNVEIDLKEDQEKLHTIFGGILNSSFQGVAPEDIVKVDMDWRKGMERPKTRKEAMVPIGCHFLKRKDMTGEKLTKALTVEWKNKRT